MQIEQLLARLNVEVVSTAMGDSELTLFLRVKTDEPTQNRWRVFITELLLHDRKDKRARWTVDIGHTYFLRENEDTPRYLWRLIIEAKKGGKKSLDEGLKRVSQAAMSALSNGVEITSMPLVGRSSHKGRGSVHGQGENAAAAMIAKEFKT